MYRLIIIYISTLLFVSLMAGNAVSVPLNNRVSRLVIAHDTNYPPFSYLDESNTPKGYLIDIWKAFGSANSIEIKFLLGTWQESLDMVKEGKADVHGGLIYSGERDHFLDYGPTITELSSHLYTMKDAINGNENSPAVGVVKGGYEEYYMRTKRPERALILFDDNKVMIKAVADGTIKAFVADQPTGSYYMNLYGIRGMVKNSKRLYSKPMRMAVGEGKHEILQFISYGWMDIDKQELKYIHGKWFMSKDSNPDWLLPCIGVPVLILIIGIAVRKMWLHAHGLDS